MIRNTDPDYVSFELDILWTVFPGHDPVTFLEKYGPRFKLMHLKDLKKGIEGNSSGNTSQENDVALGKGQLDLERILNAGKKSGVKYFYIEDESSKYNEQVPKSIEYLKRIGFIK
jgi:sugar phosphate isomerase/epimerase